MKKLLLAIALLVAAASIPTLHAQSALSLTGTVKDLTGTGVTGTITFTLSNNGILLTTGSCGGPQIITANVAKSFSLTSGAFPGGSTIASNDCISPVGTYYIVKLTSSSGTTIFQQNWSIQASACGSPCDVGKIGTSAIPSGTSVSQLVLGSIVTGTVGISPNCNSATSPAVCAGASSGSVALAAAATTLVVNTTAVTANSQILVEMDESLGTRLGVTCNTAAGSESAGYVVSARTAGTSFTIKTSSAPAANPACLSFVLVN